MNRLRFCLNGGWLEPDVPPTTTLLRYLRDHLRLTGTKEGCAEGDCGACTVAVLEPDAAGRARYRAVNSCLLLLPMLQGKHVYTVEALARQDRLHPAQKALVDALGSQCGYCTPGVVMSMFEATYRDDLDAPWKLDAQLCGNLCRCTGYRPIRDAAQQVAGTCPEDGFREALQQVRAEPMALEYSHGPQRYFIPETVKALLALRRAYPQARLVAGGTDLGLEITKRFSEPPLLISVEALPELRVLDVAANGALRIGAAVALSDVEDFTQQRCVPLARMLRYFGARQIKNRATLGGNLCTASPIGDLAPVLLALGAEAVALGGEGERRIPLDRFFTAYRQTALEPGEVLARVEVPALAAGTRAASYKVSKRRELDISTVSACFLVVTGEDGTVQTARLAFGGMAATPLRAARAEAALWGQPWTAEVVERAARELSSELRPISDHRGSARYRMAAAQNLLRAFHEETLVERVPALAHPHTATVQAR